MLGFDDLLKKRRSIRDYEERDVPLETVKAIIKESGLAPSSANGQPWRFVIITNREVIKQLSDESKKNLLADLGKDPASPSRNYEQALRNPDFNVFYNAPCLVYVCGPKDLRTLQVDLALFACYFMYSAVEKGLGTCWIGLGIHIKDPGLRNFIGMPDDYRIVAPIIIGYPKSIPAPSERVEPRILKVVS